jgi:hypothetical protein
VPLESSLTFHNFRLNTFEGAVIFGVCGLPDRVWAEEDFKWPFTIENHDSDDVNVLSIRPTCGCTKIDPNSFVVPAGGVTTVVATLDFANTAAMNPYSEEAPHRQELHGSECIVLEQVPRGPVGSIVQTLSIDPDKAFAVVRMSDNQFMGVGQPLKPWCQIDVSYAHDERFGWVPSGWESSMFYSGAGKVSTFHQIVIDDYEFNEPIDDAEFDRPFPERARVLDERSHSHSIQLADGELRPITLDEMARRATTEELMRTPVGTAGIKDHSRAVLVICGAAVAIVCLVLGSAWARRRNR